MKTVKRLLLSDMHW